MTPLGEKPASTPCSAAKLLARGKPVQSAIAMAESFTALPVVGSRLEPLVLMTAIGAWASRLVPRVINEMKQQQTEPAAAAGEPGTAEPPAPVPVLAEVCSASLKGIIGDLDGISWPLPQRFAPAFGLIEQRRRFVHRAAVRYGPHESQLLDVWRLPELPKTPAPVLIYVPGGAWVHGSRTYQGSALMSHLAAAGWVCLAIDYRVSPKHRWPRHVMDVKAAIAWARANVDQFGGDREFVTIAGASAGGHLASLAALTPNDPQYEGELEAGSDTSVDAAVSIYGRYDWHDRSTPERDGFVDFLENIVVQRGYGRHEDIYLDASPIARLNDSAPPFFVVHGESDFVIPVAQARAFVERLRATSRETVGYLELPGAQHGFDLFDRACTGSACTSIGLFLNEIHRRRMLAAAS
ncbi:MAG TPA: alpha/beta hydrolase [Mycobacterium sp.]|nr:alpha/beta hydrolase [Mycobacterium sp.]